jgi:diacylglycerol kinase family enzyme
MISNSGTVMGILPLGSGQGLARALGIPLNIRRSITVLNRMHIARIDTGLAGDFRFVNIAGIGIAAEVARGCSSGSGLMPYIMNLLRKLPGYPGAHLRLSTDKGIYEGDYLLASFANGSQWGYGARINPNSELQDGRLEICLLRKIPIFLLPWLFIRLYTGTIHRSRYMKVIPAENAEITTAGIIQGHIDGEPVAFTCPMQVSVKPASLKVICPSDN